MFTDDYLEAQDNNETDLFWDGVIELTYRNIDLKNELSNYIPYDDAHALYVKASILGVLDEIEYWKDFRYKILEDCYTKETLDELLKTGVELGIPELILKGESIYYANEALTKELERRKKEKEQKAG
jgi:hypothetical protein